MTKTEFAKNIRLALTLPNVKESRYDYFSNYSHIGEIRACVLGLAGIGKLYSDAVDTNEFREVFGYGYDSIKKGLGISSYTAWAAQKLHLASIRAKNIAKLFAILGWFEEKFSTLGQE